MCMFEALQLKQRIHKPNMKKLHVVYIEKRKLLEDNDGSYHKLRHWTKIMDSLHIAGNKTILIKGKHKDTSGNTANDLEDNERQVQSILADE